MSITIQHSAGSFASIEYEGKTDYKPKWIKEKQLLGYYNAMHKSYTESLNKIEIPDRFDKEKLLSFLMNSLKNSLNEDDELRKLVIELSKNYPKFPISSTKASEYVRLLKNLSRKIANIGQKLNDTISFDSCKSDIPYIFFSNQILGNYTISYFHEYKARATAEYFRHNRLLVRGRPNLKTRKTALTTYFSMIKPLQDMFQNLVTSKFALWLLIILYNSENLKEFANSPQYLSFDKLDQEQFNKLNTEYSEQLEIFRKELCQIEPELFQLTPNFDKATETMWNDMIKLRIVK